MSSQWPWPGDTALTRARRIAASYRAVLEDIAPDICHQLDQQMITMGVDWIVPRVVAWSEDDWMSAEQVAQYAGVSLATVYSWRHRGMPSLVTNEGIRFQHGVVRRWIAGHRDSS